MEAQLIRNNSMKIIVTTFLLAASCFLTACDTPMIIDPTPIPAPHRPIAGGFSTVNVNNPAVQDAAEFAAEALGGLLSRVLSAEQQVVAGVNYRMEIELQDGSLHDVMVYEDLQGNMSLH